MEHKVTVQNLPSTDTGVRLLTVVDRQFDFYLLPFLHTYHGAQKALALEILEWVTILVNATPKIIESFALRWEITNLKRNQLVPTSSMAELIQFAMTTEKLFERRLMPYEISVFYPTGQFGEDRVFESHSVSLGGIIPPPVRFDLTKLEPNGENFDLAKVPDIMKSKIAKIKTMRVQLQAVVFADGSIDGQMPEALVHLKSAFSRK